MSKARLNSHQFNIKQTDREWDKLQAVNKKFFASSLNNSDLGRFLLKVALDALENAKVETKTVTTLTVNGKSVDIE